MRAWTALRVVAGAGGRARGAPGSRRRSSAASASCGRSSSPFEASAPSDGSARLVTVIGEAGVGKSRLLWEFFKYTDGVEKSDPLAPGPLPVPTARASPTGRWRRWSARAPGSSRRRTPASAREKLHAAVEQFVPDERERRLVEPRLAHLLGLEQRTATDRADLFSGWRLFFERIAADEPVVLVFEDLQWADAGLLDFIDYLLEWSAEHPIFILALGRPELLTARPGWDGDDRARAARARAR